MIVAAPRDVWPHNYFIEETVINGRLVETKMPRPELSAVVVEANCLGWSSVFSMVATLFVK
jgi:hypothetical protein